MDVLTELDGDRIHALREADTFFWLDMMSPSSADLDRMSELLGLHPAAIEDSQEWSQLPRLDDYSDHALLIFFSARERGGHVEPVEVHLYVSGAWVVTVRRCETGLDAKREWIASQECDEDEVLYHVLDALTDDWDPVIDALDRRVDAVEGDVLDRPQQGQLKTIYRLKQEVTELSRRAHPQSVTFTPAMQTMNGLPGLTRGSREWLRDVDAHLDSIDSDLRRLNGDLNALTETFFNANANRLNRLATLVAVGSLFFLIWTLVTGFFGQNFGYLTRHINSKSAFFGYEIGALLIPTVLLAIILYWRRDDWW